MQKHLKFILIWILILVTLRSGLMAHPDAELLNRIYPFEEQIYNLCSGHGEMHMDQDQIDFLLREVEENYSVMLALIDKTETERFLVRLTNVVILSDLSPAEKKEFYLQAYAKSQKLQKNGEVWSDFVKLIIQKTSSLSLREIETYVDSSNDFLREVARKELVERSDREEKLRIFKQLEGSATPDNLKHDDSEERNQLQRFPSKYLYWILSPVILGLLIFLVYIYHKFPEK